MTSDDADGLEEHLQPLAERIEMFLIGEDAANPDLQDERQKLGGIYRWRVCPGTGTVNPAVPATGSAQDAFRER